MTYLALNRNYFLNVCHRDSVSAVYLCVFVSLCFLGAGKLPKRKNQSTAADYDSDAPSQPSRGILRSSLFWSSSCWFPLFQQLLVLRCVMNVNPWNNTTHKFGIWKLSMTYFQNFECWKSNRGQMLNSITDHIVHCFMLYSL